MDFKIGQKVAYPNHGVCAVESIKSKRMDGKRLQFGNEGEELVPGVTENLSSLNHQQGDAREFEGQLDNESAERGRPASFDPVTGAVHGSGPNAGGGGTAAEDYDQDSAGGEVKPPVSPGGRQ